VIRYTVYVRYADDYLIAVKALKTLVNSATNKEEKWKTIKEIRSK